MENNSFVLYGANGYTGALIATMAAQYGLRPLLAGRNEASVRKIAEKLDLPFKIADINDPKGLDILLKDQKLVVHAAGPFSRTAKQMVEACIRNGVHYTDINGDISCFDLVKSYHDQAAQANCMLMPGTGFDVVPTDCAAKKACDQGTEITRLQIAFATLGSTISHGTATTTLEKLGGYGVKRVDGKLIPVPIGKTGMMVDFGPKKIFTMSIPWGDVSTAYHTTGVPNIETFCAAPKSIYRLLKWQFLFNWLLRIPSVKKMLQGRIDKRAAGPDNNQLEKGTTWVWAKASDGKGNDFECRLSGPEGYLLTSHATLIIAKEILKGNYKSGYQTPAGCYGWDLVLKIPGVKMYQ